MRILALTLTALVLAACDTTSSVDFKGDRSSLLPGISTGGTIAFAPSSGGFTQGTSTQGATVSLSMGGNTNIVSGTTPHGYKVQFNVYSQ